MARRDLFLSLVAGLLIALFLLPTLINTEIYNKLPVSPILLLGLLPVAAVFGMSMILTLAKKLAILWQLAKFGLVGVLNTAIDFGILNWLIATTGVTQGVGIVFLNATSFSTALVNSYFWNREWVFGAGRSNFLIFWVVTVVGLSINTGVVYFLTTYVSPILVDSPTLWANFAKVLATVLSLVWNFSGYKLIVFRR